MELLWLDKHRVAAVAALNDYLKWQKPLESINRVLPNE
jgi:hypothetical protein